MPFRIEHGKVGTYAEMAKLAGQAAQERTQQQMQFQAEENELNRQLQLTKMYAQQEANAASQMAAINAQAASQSREMQFRADQADANREYEREVTQFNQYLATQRAERKMAFELEKEEVRERTKFQLELQEEMRNEQLKRQKMDSLMQAKEQGKISQPEFDRAMLRLTTNLPFSVQPMGLDDIMEREAAQIFQGGSTTTPVERPGEKEGFFKRGLKGAILSARAGSAAPPKLDTTTIQGRRQYLWRALETLPKEEQIEVRRILDSGNEEAINQVYRILTE